MKVELIIGLNSKDTLKPLYKVFNYTLCKRKIFEEVLVYFDGCSLIKQDGLYRMANNKIVFEKSVNCTIYDFDDTIYKVVNVACALRRVLNQESIILIVDNTYSVSIDDNNNNALIVKRELAKQGFKEEEK